VKLFSAKTVQDIQEATKSISLSANHLVIDSQGNIGFQQSGAMPLRKQFFSFSFLFFFFFNLYSFLILLFFHRNWSGLYPLPGWDYDNHWKGMFPKEKVEFHFFFLFFSFLFYFILFYFIFLKSFFFEKKAGSCY